MNKDLLIEIVQQLPALWDRNHKDHHNRHVLGREWKKVARKCGCTALEAKVCWKNLRQEFGKQIKRIEISPDNVLGPNTIQWYYFEKLFFLKDQFPYIKTTNNLVIEPSKELFDNVLDARSNAHSGDDMNLSPRSMFAENIESPSVMNDSLPYVPVAAVYSNQTSKANAKLHSKKRNASQADQFADLDEKRLELNNRKQKRDENDEDIAFFDSILPTVRKLSSRNKFIFRMTVQQSLFELAFPKTESITGNSNQDVNVFTEHNPELVQESLNVKSCNSYIKEETLSYEADNQ